MVSRWSEGGGDAGETVVLRRRPKWQRIGAIALLSLIVLALLAVAGLWIARRPIASEVLQRQFEQRGVRATYQLDRVGLRTQQVRNLVIGDPKDPDLVARYALIQLRWTLTGSVGVYRIVARGVRLEGKVVQGRVVWGEVSRLLPPPTNKPFALPNIVLDIADSSISLQTPAGQVANSLSQGLAT
jgi:translocation and assembly module TamB